MLYYGVNQVEEVFLVLLPFKIVILFLTNNYKYCV